MSAQTKQTTTSTNPLLPNGFVPTALAVAGPALSELACLYSQLQVTLQQILQQEFKTNNKIATNMKKMMRRSARKDANITKNQAIGGMVSGGLTMAQGIGTAYVNTRYEASDPGLERAKDLRAPRPANPGPDNFTGTFGSNVPSNAVVSNANDNANANANNANNVNNANNDANNPNPNLNPNPNSNLEQHKNELLTKTDFGSRNPEPEERQAYDNMTPEQQVKVRENLNKYIDQHETAKADKTRSTQRKIEGFGQGVQGLGSLTQQIIATSAVAPAQKRKGILDSNAQLDQTAASSLSSAIQTLQGTMSSFNQTSSSNFSAMDQLAQSNILRG